MATFSFLLTITSLITINLAGNSPEYNYKYSPDGGEDGECRFKGKISTGNSACKKQEITRTDFKQNDDLTWKILTKACPSLIYAGCADPEWNTKEHNMDELIWRPGCNSCPRCPCNAGVPSTYYVRNFTSVKFPFKSTECYECKCDDFYSNENNNDIYARDCDTDKPEAVYQTPDALQAIYCPETTPNPTPAPTGGCLDGVGNSHAPGEYFFIWDELNCDTYCYCNSTNGLECEQGWDNILASEELKYEFWDDCKYYLQDAFNDTSRWGDALSMCTQNENVFSATARCPRVTCGTYLNGNRWNGITYSQTLRDENENIEDILYDCGTCECDTGPGFGNLDVICTTYDADVTGDDQCTVSDLTCDAENQAGFESCNEGEGEVYCGWNQQLTPDGFDPDTVCIEDDVESEASWGCMNDFECDAFYGYNNLQESSKGICSYNTVSFTAKSYDCVNYKWLSETYKLETYHMCCKKQDGTTGYCNSQPILSETALGSENECTSNAALGDFRKKIYECQYGSRGISNKDYIKELECGIDLPEGKYDDDKYVCD
eukprot:834094_1